MFTQSLPFLILIVLSARSVFTDEVEKVSEEELMNLIRTEKHVVALFSKVGNCEKCETLETELAAIRETLVDSLDASVVKVVSSPMAKLYSPTSEPALVFFRHGIPLLYDGPADEMEILSKVNKCSEPAVKSLNDESFEHLTQASSGATTGDWLIMFEKRNCVKSQRLQAVLEAAACELKVRMNVARVDKSTDGGATGRRFGITHTPEFILFRHGKMYRYELDSITIQNLVDFSTDFYRNSKAENVTPPKSPFDDFVEMIVEKMRENPEIVKLGSIGVSILLILGIFIKLSSNATKKQQTASKKEKKETKKKT